MSIEPGMFVRLTGDPGRSGMVTAGEKSLAGQTHVPVQFANGRVSWLPADALEEVPASPLGLADRLAKGQFVDPEWLRGTLTRVRVTGRLSNMVYSMEATATDFYAHQFKPVLKLLASPTDALLIADEVGLGKTIEAGLIWTELRARLDCNRLLVVCPKTLCEKWRLELDRRFGVDARVVEAKELVDLLSSSQRGFAAVAGMQSLRPPRAWDSEDEAERSSPKSARGRLAQLLDEASSDEPLIDLLVVDEAHHMRNPNTLLHELGKLANAVSSHRVFLSGTPIHLRNRDLHSILRLIDPDTFEYESTLEELIRVNEPIVKARDLMLHPDSSLAEVREQIDAAGEFELLADSNALRLLREDLESCALDAVTRAEFASRLERVNQMANYVTRTRRRHIEDFRVVREPKSPFLKMCEEEQHFYEEVSLAVRDYAVEHDVNEGFLLATPQRLLTSCPAAASAYWAVIDSNKPEDVEETDDELEQNGSEDRPLLARLGKLARELDMTECLERTDTKFDLLRTIVRDLWASEPDAKMIVFSSFKPTLRYLRRRLKSDGIACELLHGSVDLPRFEILKRFETEPAIRVLLSSEVGSEGVDLQFSGFVVNYDLPWNPMRVEQRIGRVDRLGQQREKVTILSLVYDGTIEARIYERLYQRLNLIERTLGEFEAILGEPIREMALRIYNPTLTEQQRTAAIESARQALHIRGREEENLEQEAGALIRHGDYVLSKIDEGRKHHRWIRDEDILAYIRDRLSRSFSGCRIESSPPGSDTYRIILSREARARLGEFIDRRRLRGSTRLLREVGGQRYRFTSSVARDRENGVECISQFHPLARFAVELDERDECTRESEVVAASISAGMVEAKCEPGLHVIGIRQWRASGAEGRGGMPAHMIYEGVGMEESSPVSADVAEAIVGAVAARGRLLPNFANDERWRVARNLWETRVDPALDRQCEELARLADADIKDRVSIQERALKRHRDDKSMKLKAQIENLRAQAKLAKALDGLDFGSSGSDSGKIGTAPRRIRQLENLVKATEAKRRKLHENIGLRLTRIEKQRQFHPEWSDIACLMVDITR